MEKNNKNINLLQFIELYKSHEVLWNLNLKNYRRNDLKMKAYESISAEMKISVEDVKKKIKSLRTAYSAEKSKVEKSKKSGCSADSIYTPKLFWYTEMHFLNASVTRRPTVDNSNQENIDYTAEASWEYDGNEESFSEASSSQKKKAAGPSSSKKRMHSPSKLDEAVEKLIEINNKEGTVFETFGETVGRQIAEFSEEEAYEAMADIQSLLSKKKIEIIKRKKAEERDILRTAMADANIFENL